MGSGLCILSFIAHYDLSFRGTRFQLFGNPQINQIYIRRLKLLLGFGQLCFQLFYSWRLSFSRFYEPLDVLVLALQFFIFDPRNLHVCISHLGKTLNKKIKISFSKRKVNLKYFYLTWRSLLSDLLTPQSTLGGSWIRRWDSPLVTSDIVILLEFMETENNMSTFLSMKNNFWLHKEWTICFI